MLVVRPGAPSTHLDASSASRPARSPPSTSHSAEGAAPQWRAWCSWRCSGLADAPAHGTSVVAPGAGMTITSPTVIRFGFLMFLFAARMWSTETLKRRAIVDSVFSLADGVGLRGRAGLRCGPQGGGLRSRLSARRRTLPGPATRPVRRHPGATGAAARTGVGAAAISAPPAKTTRDDGRPTRVLGVGVGLMAAAGPFPGRLDWRSTRRTGRTGAWTPVPPEQPAEASRSRPRNRPTPPAGVCACVEVQCGRCRCRAVGVRVGSGARRSRLKATPAPNRRRAAGGPERDLRAGGRRWSRALRARGARGSRRGCTDRRRLAAREFGVLVVLAEMPLVADLLLLERAIGYDRGSRGPGPRRRTRAVAPPTYLARACDSEVPRAVAGQAWTPRARSTRPSVPTGSRRIERRSIPARPTACRGARARHRAGRAHSSRGAPEGRWPFPRDPLSGTSRSGSAGLPPAAGCGTRAASRRAQSWKVGQTGKLAERQ